MNIAKISELRDLFPKMRGFLPKTDFEVEESAGVYVLQYGDRYYVGMAANLKHRLGWHVKAANGEVTDGGGVSPKYWSIVRKHSGLLKIFVIEAGVECDNPRTRAQLERFWILAFWKSIGAARLMNVFIDSKRKRKMRSTTAGRLSKSICMSETIRAAHKDHAYKARAKEIASDNWHKVPKDKRQKLSENTSKIIKRYFKDPVNRKKQADNVKRQWQDPKFLEINQERLRKLRDSGWKPTPANVIKVILPDGSKFTLLQKDLVSVLRLGDRKQGPLSVFDSNKMLSDWRVKTIGEVAGHLRLSRETEFRSEIDRFCNHPFIRWLIQSKDKHPKLTNLTPVKVEFQTGEQFRCLKKITVHSAGRDRVPGIVKITEIGSLYEFATLKLPVLH